MMDAIKLPQPETKNVWPSSRDARSPADFASPDCDIEESDRSYILSFFMPGLDARNIQIEIDGRNLHVGGTRKIDEGRYPGGIRTFDRTVQIPSNRKAEKLTTSYRCGVLSVIIPKV